MAENSRCKIPGNECSPPGTIGFCGGLCSAHYQRAGRHNGDPLGGRSIMNMPTECELAAENNCTKRGSLRFGLCEKHYKRMVKYGDPRISNPYTERGAGKIACDEALDMAPTGDCLIWEYRCNSLGYAAMRYKPLGYVFAHQYVCHMEHGPPPTDKHVTRHLCGKGNQGCYAPWHLEWSTQAVNMQDMVDHGTGKRHNKTRGHKLDPWQAKLLKFGKESPEVLAVRFDVSLKYAQQLRSGSETSWRWLTPDSPDYHQFL